MFTVSAKLSLKKTFPLHINESKFVCCLPVVWVCTAKQLIRGVAKHIGAYDEQNDQGMDNEVIRTCV